MGLQTTKESNVRSTFLTVTGGKIWDKKQTAEHPMFEVQKYVDKDGNDATRQGACYPALSGYIVDVRVAEHDVYGQSIQVTFQDDTERNIVSISTNNRFSQDMLKMLLKVDVTNKIWFKPHDFINKEKKRVQGIVFRLFHKDGEKIALRNEEAPFKDADFFKTANKKQKKRFFEDLTDWFVDAVQKTVIDVNFTKDENGQLINPVSPISTEVEAEVVKSAPAEKATKTKKATKAIVAEEATAEDLAAEFEDLV